MGDFVGGRGPPRSGLAAKLALERAQKDQVSGHKTGLPEKLLKLFQPRPPLRFVRPKRRRGARQPMTGLAQHVPDFAGPGEPEFEPAPKNSDLREPRIVRNPELPLQARIEEETKPEKVLRLRKESAEEALKKAEEAVASWDPNADPKAEGSDPFKTLFVGRLSYEVNERKLKREFEEYGPVKRVRIVTDDTGKPRGYAFVEFEHKTDMKTAYKMADGKKLEDRRMLVDVERGRTVPNWKPRRLGGGKGGETRAAKEPKKPKKKFMAKILEAATRGESRPDRERGEIDKEDRDRERSRRERDERDARDREKPREHARDRDRDRHISRDRDRERDYRGVPPPREYGGSGGGAPRERRRSRSRSRDRSRRDRSRGGSERKRERDIEEGERSGSKRHQREEGEKANGHEPRRERDV